MRYGLMDPGFYSQTETQFHRTILRCESYWQAVWNQIPHILLKIAKFSAQFDKIGRAHV